MSKWLQTIVVLTLIGALTGFFIFFLFLGSRRVIRYKLELLEHRTRTITVSSLAPSVPYRGRCVSCRVVRWRFDVAVLSGCGGSPGGTCFWYPFLTFVGISTGLTACSSFLVAYFLPFAASGLPELQGSPRVSCVVSSAARRACSMFHVCRVARRWHRSILICAHGAAFLNGIKMPSIFRVSSFFVKVRSINRRALPHYLQY